MDVTVHYRKLLISPRKIRTVLHMVRGRRVSDAVSLIAALAKPTAEPVQKLLMSSVSAARDRDARLGADDLIVKEIFCNEGTRLYRTRLKGRGRASRFVKRGSHLTLTVSARPLKPATSPAAKAARAGTKPVSKKPRSLTRSK